MSTQKQGFKQNLIEEFSDSSAAPDPKFINKLEEKLVRELNDQPQSNLILSLFNMSKMKLAAAGIAALALVTTGVVGYPYVKDFYIRETVDLKEVLAKAAKNKTDLANSSQRYNALASSAGDSANSLLESGYLGYWGTPNMYNETKIKYDYGSAIDRCGAVSMPFYNQKVGSSESYSYVLEENGNYKYYDKNVIRTEDGQLLSFYLVNQDGSYSFMGGEYAIKDLGPLYYQEEVTEVLPDEAPSEIEDTAVSMPAEDINGVPTDYIAEETETTNEEIDPSDFWGENQELLGTTDINGREHYIITYDTYMPCSFEESMDLAVSSYYDPYSKEGMDKIAMKVYIDVENSNISREEMYLETISDSNLIVKTDYSYRSEEIDYVKVQDKFRFDYNVEIKEVNTTSYYNWEDNLENIKEVNIDILVPSDDTWKLSDVYNNRYMDQYTLLYTAREFYPDSELGEEMYRQANLFQNGTYLIPYLTGYYEYQVDGSVYQSRYIDMGIYDLVDSDEDMINSGLGYGVSDSPTTASITINGQQVEGNLYEIEWEFDTYPESRGGSAGSEGSASGEGSTGSDLIAPYDPGVELMTSEYAFIFEYSGYKYLLHIYVQDEVEVGFELPGFTALKSRSDYEEIKSIIKQYRDSREYEVLPTEPK